MGEVVATRSGASLDGKRRVFILDIVGAGEKTEGLRVDLGASAGKISNVSLVSNSALHGLRASFELDPSNADLIELRLRIMRGDAPGQRNMAVPMDLHLSSAVRVAPAESSGGMPPESRLGMPSQDLRLFAGAIWFRPTPSAAEIFARIILVATSIGVTVYGVYQMLQVVRFASMTWLQGLMIFFFAISLAWIAFSAGSVIAGASKRRDPRPDRRAGHGRHADRAGDADLQRGSDAHHRGAAGDGRGAAVRLGANGAFEIVVLSDSTECRCVDPRDRGDRAAAPRARRRRCRSGTGGAGATSRASRAMSRISSRRWGGRYDHMIVLDADSLIDASTLMRLAQMMHADPALGILQTAPQLIGARTLFGRLQQFAACAYGPVISRGLAAWSGDSGNYWGHNAIIRVRAFAESCGLPELEGRKPFGGHVLSHDFVEAALMRRAGWKVRMATDCGGSWEESPPVAHRRRHPRPALGAGQSAAHEDHRRVAA